MEWLNTMFLIALIAFAILYGFIAVVSIIVLYHLKKFGVEPTKDNVITKIFTIGSLLLFVFSLTTFLATPWSKLPINLSKLLNQVTDNIPLPFLQIPTR